MAFTTHTQRLCATIREYMTTTSTKVKALYSNVVAQKKMRIKRTKSPKTTKR